MPRRVLQRLHHSAARVHTKDEPVSWGDELDALLRRASEDPAELRRRGDGRGRDGSLLGVDSDVVGPDGASCRGCRGIRDTEDVIAVARECRRERLDCARG